ncbi:MAG: sulfur carrier protein ThiS [Tepidimonas sp.]|uniref:sulfur carrier protein ThiS n=1 Tax=Tepidimonas sp. TaxID=2002775 RepID=UPI00259FBF23|nr:sulfur carrier protein ThiS [Tepidimonas sp.]MDM7456897.1 sulfur carrier protein ThiS [Tepidimonas sp.]
MQVLLKLFATLEDYLPPGSRFNQVEITVADGATVQAVIDQHRLPPKLVHLVLVNGVFIPPSERSAHRLTPGDVLAVWPPIAGG